MESLRKWFLVEENSRLKKIIDLYVDKGLDDEYLHDEMVKALNI